MEPESQPEKQNPPVSDPESRRASTAPMPGDSYGFLWIIWGPQGVRVGWLVLLFYCLFRLFEYLAGGIAYALAPDLINSEPSALKAALLELVQFSAMLGAGAIMSRFQPADVPKYYLRDVRAARHLISGFAIGFLALSALVGSLVAGNWMRFGRTNLHASAAFTYGALWLLAFCLVGCVEEGTFRCYGLWTLVRGMNFWWALALTSGFCAYGFLFIPGQCIWGVYAVAALGLAPCLLVHLRQTPNGNFWQAAWATSTGFGFVHTLNTGENWIGIFAAALIGFVFCVSIWATGSAWWAIGCHAAWDWAETYFYGTADSGFVAPGHLLSTSPAGNPLWSGGTDGPEGSLLIIPIVLLILIWLLMAYRRPRPELTESSAATEPLAS